MNPDTSKIRQFLRDRFDDEELTAFCFDHFHEVYQNFTEGMTKKRKIQLLLEHCQRQEKLPPLLSALKQARPELYKLELGEVINTQATAVTPQQTILPQSQQPQQEHTPSPIETWLTAVKQAPFKMMGVPLLAVLLVIALLWWGISQLNDRDEIAATPAGIAWQGSSILVEIDHFQGEIQLNEAAAGTLRASDSDTWLFVTNEPIIIDILLEGIEIESGYIRLFKESDAIENPYKEGQAIELREIAKITNVSLDVGRYMIAVQDALGDGHYTLTIQKRGIETAVTMTPEPITLDIPVEISGEIFEITAVHIVSDTPGNISFAFSNNSEKEPVNVIIEKANGGGITTSSDMNRGDDKIVSTLLSSDLSGVRIKIFRWAPGAFGVPGSGGGEAFLTLPTTGDVEITIKVTD
jgi:hypothetical protein